MMSKKFENLPVGCVVELNDDGKLYWQSNGWKQMTIFNRFVANRKYGQDGYLTEELEEAKQGEFLPLRYIQRVISFPIDRDKLKPGISVLIRSDLEMGTDYGSHGTVEEMKEFFGEVVTIHSGLDGDGIFNDIFEIKEDNQGSWWTVQMIEKIIEEPVVEMVDGVEALVVMKEGEYILLPESDNWHEAVFKFENSKTMFLTKKDSKKKWKIDNCLLDIFIGRKYQILDTLPEWAQEPNPFKIGDIVVNECKPSKVLKVKWIHDSNHFCARTPLGDKKDLCNSYYRLATQEEELNFWKARAEYLEAQQ